MTEQTEDRLILAGVLVIIALTVLVGRTAYACEPDDSRGKVCAEHVPPIYARACADGCWIVRDVEMRRLSAASMAAEELPGLRANVAKLLGLLAETRDQRDAATKSADLALDALSARTGEVMELQRGIADAPSWSTVILAGGVGVVVGVVAGIVLVVVM